MPAFIPGAPQCFNDLGQEPRDNLVAMITQALVAYQGDRSKMRVDVKSKFKISAEDLRKVETWIDQSGSQVTHIHIHIHTHARTHHTRNTYASHAHHTRTPLASHTHITHARQHHMHSRWCHHQRLNQLMWS
jgi:hypothetical protein